MKAPWNTIDRWGPGMLSVLTILMLAALGWQYSGRLARTEGEMGIIRDDANTQQIEMIALRNEIETLQAYIVVLRVEMVRGGLNAPDFPRANSSSAKPVR